MIVKPTGLTIGAEIENIDLSQAISEMDITAIEAALVEHKVLFFRDQKLTTHSHLELGRRFGALELHPFLKEVPVLTSDRKNPEIVVVESTPERPGVAEKWHSDVTWRSEPSLGSILRVTHCAQSGGDTIWSDMVAAYDSLDDATQSALSGMVAIHDWEGFRRSMRASGVSEQILTSLAEQYPQVEHPIVRTHPVSERKLIYVNAAFTVGIKGMEDIESKPLLERLYALADNPDFHARMTWRPGSVAFWDNRSTQHMVTNDVVGRRRLERVTIAGDRPF